MEPRRRNLVEIAEQHNPPSVDYAHRDDIYSYYAKQSQMSLPHETEREFAPYPPLITERAPYGQSRLPVPVAPHPPPKEYRNYYSPRQPSGPISSPLLGPELGKELPPVQDSREYAMTQGQALAIQAEGNLHDREVKLESENILLEKVMNRPVFTLGPKYYDPALDPSMRPRNYTVTVTNIIDLFQVAFGIIVMTLASVLTGSDDRISAGIYRYFIAVGVITLVVSLLFITKAINFEKRNGIFYCLLVCVLTGVSLILSITSIATNNNCAKSAICLQRKVLATFAILSFFLWICTLVMFLTTLYISRMNLLEDINFDYSQGVQRAYSQKLRPPTYYNEDISHGYQSDKTRVDEFPTPEQEYPQYFLNESGEMYPLQQHQDTRGTRKMIVYAPL